MALAQRAKVGFVMIRKAGKLPPPVLQNNYETEYSKDSMEIATDIIKPDSTVVIIDDLVATGGSLISAYDLILQLNNVTILGGFCVLSVDSLKEVVDEKLKNYPNMPIIKLF